MRHLRRLLHAGVDRQGRQALLGAFRIYQRDDWEAEAATGGAGIAVRRLLGIIVRRTLRTVVVWKLAGLVVRLVLRLVVRRLVGKLFARRILRCLLRRFPPGCWSGVSSGVCSGLLSGFTTGQLTCWPQEEISKRSHNRWSSWRWDWEANMVGL